MLTHAQVLKTILSLAIIPNLPLVSEQIGTVGVVDGASEGDKVGTVGDAEGEGDGFGSNKAIVNARLKFQNEKKMNEKAS